MSGTNGDRARFDRRRKARMHDRARIRKLQKALKSPQPVIGRKDEPTPA
jgi:hypothetical protein